MTQQKIVPHLWFDKEAKDAVAFYTSLFPNSKITNTTTIHNAPSNDFDIVSFTLSGQNFMAMNAGPLFKFNPSVSFLVACETKNEVDTLWENLSKDGTPLMPLNKYPFSDWYGWIQDQYGLSWQIMLMGDRTIRQKITPTMMFVGTVCGKAEEAINFYTSVFHTSNIDHVLRYGKGNSPDKERTVKHAGFTLEGVEFSAMDSAHDHKFSFNESISFIVYCDTQQEIDYYWEKLSADPKSEQCGWLKDTYGVSWQIDPRVLKEMMTSGDQEKIARVVQAFLKMKKFDVETLKKAYEGE